MLEYIKEMFEMFLDQTSELSRSKFSEHYDKLQRQFNEGKLDEQLMNVTFHNDPADLFNEFYDIHPVKEEEIKQEFSPRYTNEEMVNNSNKVGLPVYNELVKSTTLQLVDMNKREIWSYEILAHFDELAKSDAFRTFYDNSQAKVTIIDGTEVKYYNLDGIITPIFWYWLGGGCVRGVIANHYRIMVKTGFRTLYGTQSRNIGEVVVRSMGLTWTDNAYNILGELASTAVTVSDLPEDPEINVDGPMFGTAPRGKYFSISLFGADRSLTSFVDKEEHPKEPCTGTSTFYAAGETEDDYYDTSETAWNLYWVFMVVERISPFVGGKEWFDSSGHSVDKQ